MYKYFYKCVLCKRVNSILSLSLKWGEKQMDVILNQVQRLS